MANLKLYFGTDDIRRVRIEDASWAGFVAKMKQLYPEYLAAESWMIKYKDEEGDLITVMSPREWDTMIQTEQSSVAPIKLYVTEKPMAPTVSIVKIEAPAEEEKAAEPELEKQADVVEEQVVPEATGEKEVEQPLETALGFEVVQPSEDAERTLIPTNDNFEGLMDMDVGVFFDRLRHQACSLLNPAENDVLKKGKEFLQGLVPNENSPVVQDLIDVVDCVKQVFHDGYTNLRDLPEIKEFVTVLSSLGGGDGDQKKQENQWGAQLELLHSMGFTDRETNEALLTKYRGNVQKVVDTLLPEMH